MASKKASKTTSKTAPKTAQYFISREGIDWEVISTNICLYLGYDALVWSGIYSDPRTGQKQEGYFINAYRGLTSAELAVLKLDSAEWREEKRKKEISRKLPSSYSYNSFESGPDPSYTAPPQAYYSIPSASQQTSFSMPLASEQVGYSMEVPHIPSASNYAPPNTQRPAPLRSQSEPAPSLGGNIRDIRLIHPMTGYSRNAAALLDTGCVTDNWVSGQAVTNLGANALIQYGGPVKTLQAANMDVVESKGTITLDWRWLPKGVKVNRATFNVADASHYDVIIGNEYLDENRLHKWNEDAFTPLTEHDPVISPYESEAMRLAKEKQEQEKADREAAKSRRGNERDRERERRGYR